MVLRLEEKQAIVSEVADVANNALSAVAADYRGLTVSEMCELRSKARASGVYVRVVRNTLARRALKETRFGCMEEVLAGPIILAFSSEDPGAAARLVRDFSKDHEALEVKGLSLDGQLLSAAELSIVANLPTREQALVLLMLVMKAPITKMARTFTEVYAKLVRTLAAVADAKQ